MRGKRGGEGLSARSLFVLFGVKKRSDHRPLSCLVALYGTLGTPFASGSRSEEKLSLSFRLEGERKPSATSPNVSLHSRGMQEVWSGGKEGGGRRGRRVSCCSSKHNLSEAMERKRRDRRFTDCRKEEEEEKVEMRRMGRRKRRKRRRKGEEEATHPSLVTVQELETEELILGDLSRRKSTIQNRHRFLVALRRWRR